VKLSVSQSTLWRGPCQESKAVVLFDFFMGIDGPSSSLARRHFLSTINGRIVVEGLVFRWPSRLVLESEDGWNASVSTISRNRTARFFPVPVPVTFKSVDDPDEVILVSPIAALSHSTQE